MINKNNVKVNTSLLNKSINKKNLSGPRLLNSVAFLCQLSCYLGQSHTLRSQKKSGGDKREKVGNFQNKADKKRSHLFTFLCLFSTVDVCSSESGHHSVLRFNVL